MMKSSRVAKTLANPMPLMSKRPIDDIIKEIFAEDDITNNVTTNNTESFFGKDKKTSESLSMNQ